MKILTDEMKAVAAIAEGGRRIFAQMAIAKHRAAAMDGISTSPALQTTAATVAASVETKPTAAVLTIETVAVPLSRIDRVFASMGRFRKPADESEAGGAAASTSSILSPAPTRADRAFALFPAGRFLKSQNAGESK